MRAACHLAAELLALPGIDEQALLAACGNAIQNQVNIEFCAAADRAGRAADIVVANILAHPLIVLAPLLGRLSDRIGRKPVLLLATFLGFVGAVPALWLLNHQSVMFAFLGQLVLVLMIGIYGGTQPTIMVEAAPVQVRCTAVALGYNICLGVIGGMTPLAATWLVNRTGDETAPAFLIMAAAAVTFMTILRFRETYRAPFVGSSPVATAYA